MQHSSWARISGTLALVWLLIAAMTACSRTQPEQAVRQQLEALQKAIDARDTGAVQDLLAEDFIGNHGMNRRGARQLAVAVFLQHRDVGARLGPVTVEVRSETEATAKFSVLATGGNSGLLPTNGQVFDFETGWRLVDGKWRLLNARWTPEF
ncbi:nuclear transport factor 2 family protein [Thermomonas sp.]|uniref:nuclear transport factor 2 family protein n=1 Tax=Thermomonas sp. TaxID=1971895 RepID=UPI00248956CC|nr:nuclear transport factor 2 family protein [Thermomonas sp.]MDI1253359.1 nuclear transport factor 2 family protein [Thermomonas sp.]